MYVAGVYGRRQGRKIDDDMEKITKTKRPLRARYAGRVIFAFTSMTFLMAFLNLFMLDFSADRFLWQRAFLIEGAFLLMLAVLPFLPTSRNQVGIHIGDPGAKWWLVTTIATAAILALLSVLITYVF